MNRKKKIKAVCHILCRNYAFKKSFLNNLIFLVKIFFSAKGCVLACLVEHLGDIIAAEPITQNLRRLHPDKKIVWFVSIKYVELLENNPNVDNIKTVTCLTEWIFLRPFIRKENFFDFNLHGRECETYSFSLYKKDSKEINTSNYYNQGNLLYAFSRSGGLTTDPCLPPVLHLRRSPKEKIYPSTYIVFHTTSNSRLRMWDPQHWSEMVSYVAGYFPQYSFIEVGTSRQIYSAIGNYLDFTGVRSLCEISSLISHCKLFIGIDSGFAHMANAQQKNSIILLGEMDLFKWYQPYSGFFYEYDFKVCVHYPGKLDQMPFDYFKEQLIAALMRIK